MVISFFEIFSKKLQCKQPFLSMKFFFFENRLWLEFERLEIGIRTAHDLRPRNFSQSHDSNFFELCHLLPNGDRMLEFWTMNGWRFFPFSKTHQAHRRCNEENAYQNWRSERKQIEKRNHCSDIENESKNKKKTQNEKSSAILREIFLQNSSSAIKTWLEICVFFSKKGAV